MVPTERLSLMEVSLHSQKAPLRHTVATSSHQTELAACTAEESLLSSHPPPFMNNCGALIRPAATETWLTAYTVSVKGSDFSPGNQNPQQSPPGQDGSMLNSTG